jgi:hypothetical protein
LAKKKKKKKKKKSPFVVVVVVYGIEAGSCRDGRGNRTKRRLVKRLSGGGRTPCVFFFRQT